MLGRCLVGLARHKFKPELERAWVLPSSRWHPQRVHRPAQGESDALSYQSRQPPSSLASESLAFVLPFSAAHCEEESPEAWERVW